MLYLGDFAAGATVYVPFHTFNAAGASVTISGLAVTDIEVYKNGSTTQRASDAGYTLLDTDGTDFDGITGIHGFSINTGDNTDAGFYSSGADYMVVVSAITADSQTISFVAAIFSIENRSALRPTTSGRTLDVASTGEAGLDFSNVLLPTSGPIPSLGVIESGTAQSVTSTTLVGRAAATDDIVKAGNILWAYGTTQGYWQSVVVTSVSGDTLTIAAWPQATPSGTITYLIFGTPSVPSTLPLAANVTQIGGSAVSTSTAQIGVNVVSVATDAITSSAVASSAVTEIQSGLATSSALTTVAGYIDTEVAAILAAVDTEVAAIKAKTDSLTFTKANELDVNLQSINDVTVNGNGAGTPWGP